MADGAVIEMTCRVLFVVLLHVGLAHYIGGVVSHEGLLVLEKDVAPVRQVLLLKVGCAAYLLMQLLDVALMPLRHVVKRTVGAIVTTGVTLEGSEDSLLVGALEVGLLYILF